MIRIHGRNPRLTDSPSPKDRVMTVSSLAAVGRLAETRTIPEQKAWPRHGAKPKVQAAPSGATDPARRRTGLSHWGIGTSGTIIEAGNASRRYRHATPSTGPSNAGGFVPDRPRRTAEASQPQLLELADGDTLELRVGPVAKPLGDTTVRMLGYNGSIPGSTLKVAEGTEIVVHVENHGDLDTTVHWHGLRLENRYDGVPHETQAPIPVGGEFSYRIQFPDPGLYWYHPHIREDYTQELGLYGNILVVPADPDYWPPADRDLILTLDDLLIEDGKIAPFSPTETSYAAMGRFGNRLLVAGDPDLRLSFPAGEVVRLWLTNTANTRVFNVTLPGARIKLVGGDSGRVEHEEFVEHVVLAPSERVVVDVLVESPGELALEHHTPNRTYRLAAITVTEGAPSTAATRFGQLRRAPELEAERAQLDRWLAAAPDKILALVAQMDDPAAMPEAAGPVTYACPMHPDVTSPEPGRCPKCGMKLLATQAPTVTAYACPMHPDVVSDQPGHCPKCGMKLLAAGSERTATADHDHAGIDHSGSRGWTTTVWTHSRHGPQRHGPRGRGGHRVGGRHGRGQPPDHQRHHALAVPRPDHRRRQPPHRLAVHRRRPGQDPADQ